MSNPVTLSKGEARRIALVAQGFDVRRTGQLSPWGRIMRAVETMGLLQIDSVNVLIRSHYMPVYSRLGPYDRKALDRRAFGLKRKALFEYWAHEASLLPICTKPSVASCVSRPSLKLRHSARASKIGRRSTFRSEVASVISGHSFFFLGFGC